MDLVCKMVGSESLKEVGEKLKSFLGPEFISSRVGEGGRRFHYVEGHQLISIANEVFGFDGWSNCVVDRRVDFEHEVDGRWTIAVSVVNRVQLSKKYGEVYHEDIGCGTAEKMSSRSKAYEKANKEAATDAMKRCLRLFGESLGNCLYSKPYLDRIARVRDRGSDIDFDESRLYRLDINLTGKRRCLGANGVKVEEDIGSGKRQCLDGSKGRSGPPLFDRPLVVGDGGPPGWCVDDGFVDEDLDWPDAV